jgi:ABC-2 type transport system ATP-binding protein
VIEVQNLVKRFGETTALDGLTFSMRRGEILGFLGPNGAGKTTTIRILTGYLTPTGGSAVVAGTDVRRNPREARRHIGYLPESVPIYREMTVNEYLNFVSELKNVPAKSRLSHLNTIIDQCGLSSVQHKLAGNLSKGFRQRLGLAQALISDPDILILDEPTTGLDPRQIIEIRELIRNLGGRRTVILSSHILPEVSQLCERVIILNKGRLIAVDSPDNLGRSLNCTDTISAEIAGDGNLPGLLDKIRAITGTGSTKDVTPPGLSSIQIQIASTAQTEIRHLIARTIIESGWELLELKKQTHSLEDIFIQLVTREESEA